MLNTLRRRADYATLSRRAAFREWTREVRLREYVKRALKATAAVAVIILAGGAVYSLAEGRQFAELLHRPCHCNDDRRQRRPRAEERPGPASPFSTRCRRSWHCPCY